MKTYKNEKLNIEIIDNVLDVKEFYNNVELYDNDVLRFKIYNNSTVGAYDNSTVIAYENSTVIAYENSKVIAYDNSTVIAYENSKVVAYDNSTVRAYDNSTVEVYNNSKVVAYENSTVEVYNNSTVEAYGNSKVEAKEFSCVFIKSINAKITKQNHFGAIIGQVFETEKDILVYKKLEKNLIATLQLKKGQVFQSENHDKCRTDKALVVSIETVDKSQSFEVGYSQNDNKFEYKVGQVVSAKYDENIRECSTGIHFFLTREKAEAY
jgi:hypothetical protein